TDDSSDNTPAPVTHGVPDPLDRLLASLPQELKVVNLLNFQTGAPRQILVHAKIVDIDRSALKNLGISYGSLITGLNRGNESIILQPQPILFGQSTGQVPSASGYSLFGGGLLHRMFPLAAQLNALITENKARVLSEPRLIVLDGNEGSMLVGGEIPIPVSSSHSGNGGDNIHVEFKKFGIQLTVAALLTNDHTIQMTVTPEVSDLDYVHGVAFNGLVIPGLSVRRATSTLQMADGETLVIGGLYSNTASRQTQRIPLLSQIPILGEFFKTTTTRKEESELLILIQPEIVKPTTADALPPPLGTLENLPAGKPDVGRHDFDRDFPSLPTSPKKTDQKPEGAPR
ncbi:MAG: hypothetical protein M3Y13_12225, partial [Armatimonadota bacterium]|nr:hypothetical protein [Armatimonadota bacterium]